MAIAIRTSSIGDAVSRLDVIQKPATGPTAAWTFPVWRQKFIAEQDWNSIPNHARRQKRCSYQTMIFYLRAKPGRHDRISSFNKLTGGAVEKMSEKVQSVFQRTGLGKLTGLRFPAASTARTPKKKLSFDMFFMVKVVTFPTERLLVQTAEVVSRHTIS